MEKTQIKEMVNMVEAIKGVSFVSAVHTAKETGEIARFVLNVGISHRTVLTRDLKVLRGLAGDQSYKNGLAGKYGEELVTRAFAELEKSIIDSLNGNNVHALAQIGAYCKINNGIKLGIETRELYLYGYKVSKKVLKTGTYKNVKSRPLTLCKNEIKSHFKSTNYRTLRFDGTETFTTGGKTLNIG